MPRANRDAHREAAAEFLALIRGGSAPSAPAPPKPDGARAEPGSVTSLIDVGEEVLAERASVGTTTEAPPASPPEPDPVSEAPVPDEDASRADAEAAAAQSRAEEAEARLRRAERRAQQVLATAAEAERAAAARVAGAEARAAEMLAEAEALVRGAEARAPEILAEAEARAAELVADAEARAPEMLAEAEARAAEVLAEAEARAAELVADAEARAASAPAAPPAEPEASSEPEAVAPRRHDQTDPLVNQVVVALSRTLRDPVMLVEGLAETLSRSDELDPAAREDLARRIRQRAAEARRTVDEIVDLARLRTGNRQLELEVIGLKAVVDRALEAGQEVLGSRRVLVTVNDPAPVRIDRAATDRALIALFENAVAYSGPETVIRINARADEKEAVVSVSDDGVGIPRSEQEDIFEPFVRGSVRGASAGPGLGLGLALARSCVEAVGGSIRVQSAPGVGSTFYLTLPLAAPDQ